MRPILLSLALCLITLSPALAEEPVLLPSTPEGGSREGMIANAPGVNEETFKSAWTRLQGNGTNLQYIQAAADKFNLNPSILAAVLLTDLLSNQKSWTQWQADHPEVRSAPTFGHLSPTQALAMELVRTDLVMEPAEEVYQRKKNDVAYMYNPEPGVDHWYQSVLEATAELMREDPVQIGIAARYLRRVGDRVRFASPRLYEPYAQMTEEDVLRMLSRANALPEGTALDWEALAHGRQPWTTPTFAWVYGSYRASQFDGLPNDELMGLATQALKWVTTDPEALAALALPADPPPLIDYVDVPEDYSFPM